MVTVTMVIVAFITYIVAIAMVKWVMLLFKMV